LTGACLRGTLGLISVSSHFAAPVLLALLAGSFAACSSEETTPNPTPSGGSGGAATGGASGGKAATGGIVSTGGTPSTGGTVGTTGGAGGATGGAAGSAGKGGAVATGGGGVGTSGSAGSAGNGGAAGGASGGAGGNAGTAGKGGAGGTAGAAGNGGSGGSGGGGTFTLKSPAFDNVSGCAKATPTPCDVFPDENLSYMMNLNVSPELSWSGVPSGTQSFALVLQDLTNGQAHWVIWNIPGSVTMVAEDIPKTSAMPAMPAGAQQCNASFATGDGYFGPGSACNVYEFVLYALSMATFSPTPATDAGQVRTQLQALDAQILGTASLRGRSNYMMMCND
jgi:Raf kinase inhibitor-like YbhB/YbcL family protein